MDILKSIFPFAFIAKDKDTDTFVKLIIAIIVGMVVCALGGFILGWIPLLGFLIKIVLGLVDFYLFVTLVIAILVYLGILND